MCYNDTSHLPVWDVPLINCSNMQGGLKKNLGQHAKDVHSRKKYSEDNEVKFSLKFQANTTLC